jgi:hypothetical protein
VLNCRGQHEWEATRSRVLFTRAARERIIIAQLSW